MKLQVFAIRDIKGEYYFHPMYSENTQTALREFSDLINGKDNRFAAHPEDYMFFHLGEWDNKTGVITYKKEPSSLGIGIDFAKNKPVLPEIKEFKREEVHAEVTNNGSE
jgi:hypothetical protein